MTAVAASARPAHQAAHQAASTDRRRRPLVAIERDLTATAALAAYSLTVAAGFARVFSGWDFLVDLAFLVVFGHGASFVMRRARVPGWIAIPALAVGLVWVLCVYQYQATMSWLLPGNATWDQVQLDIDLVRDQFQVAVAPVIYDVGWATLAGLAMIIAIVMADSFAFRAEARGEALVPGGVLFIFIAALGSPRLRIFVTALLIAVAIVAAVALRALHDRRRRVELRSDRNPGSLALPATLAMAGIVAILAGVVGPRLPGAQSDPLYETRGRGGGVTNIQNPLVDIRSRLVNQGNVELFRVNADAEAYWRVAALSEFDGRTFRLPKRELSRIDENAGSSALRQIRQQIQILSLQGELVPAAAEPVAAEPTDQLRFDRDDFTLVKTEQFRPGDQFTVVSEVPDVTPDELRATTAAAPPDDIYLELPDDLPSVVGQLADEVTVGAATDYDRVIALQDWLRTFEYSTEVQSGHGSNAIESFLQVRVGYCEQFAATFAAMARTLGIATRVAVGYTPGRIRDDGWYSVLGKNAHAWPEVWFDGVGWVAFEPTPGRGIPGGQSYTGVTPAQDTSPPDSGGRPADATATLPPTPTTVFRPPSTAPRDPRIEDPDARQTPRPDGGAAATTDGDDSGFGPVQLAIGALAVGAVAFPAAARRWRSRSTRRRGPHQRVLGAWKAACRSAARAGVPGEPSMTTHEWAHATAAVLPVAARPMASLATVVDRYEFSRPETVDADAAGMHPEVDCELWSDQIGRIAKDRLTAPQRVGAYFTDWRS